MVVLIGGIGNGSRRSEGAGGSVDVTLEIGLPVVLVFVFLNGGIALWRCGKSSFCVFPILI